MASRRAAPPFRDGLHAKLVRWIIATSDADNVMTGGGEPRRERAADALLAPVTRNVRFVMMFLPVVKEGRSGAPRSRICAGTGRLRRNLWRSSRPAGVRGAAPDSCSAYRRVRRPCLRRHSSTRWGSPCTPPRHCGCNRRTGPLRPMASRSEDARRDPGSRYTACRRQSGPPARYRALPGRARRH